MNAIAAAAKNAANAAAGAAANAATGAEKIVQVASPSKVLAAPAAPPAPAARSATSQDNISAIFTVIITIFALAMVTMTLIIGPIAIHDLLSYSSSRVSQYNSMQNGEVVLIKDALESIVLKYASAKNSDQEKYNVYRDVEFGKVVLQMAGYSILAFVILTMLLMFLTVNNSIAGTSPSLTVLPVGLDAIYKPIALAVVIGVLYWAFIKFVYINAFEENVLVRILKAQEAVNAFNNTVAQKITNHTTVLSKIALDNEGEFKTYIASLSDRALVVKAIVHYNLYAYFKATTNSFSSSDIRKKLVGTLRGTQVQFSDWINIGCSKMIKNQLYDMQFAFHPNVGADAVEQQVSVAMSEINLAKSAMKSELDILIPKFGSYLMQRMIATVVIFLISVVTVFAIYKDELAVVIQFLRGWLARPLSKKEATTMA